MGHASYSYPSHLVVLLDFSLVVVLGSVLLIGPAPLSRTASWIERWIRALARRPAQAVLLVGLLGTVGNALVFAVLGPPLPRVTDEFSYLLAADTFASGRLANPSHPMWRHFDVHSLQWPAYASKYPPAQGLLLAAGQILGGSAAVGLCLAAGLLGAACCWMFMAWFRPWWAVLGGVVVVLRLGVGSYWNQSYWGGSVAAIGGALLFGALGRLRVHPETRSALVLAAGLVILANSRPYEGFLICLPAAWVVLTLGWKQPDRPEFLRRVVVPVGIVVVLAAAAMAYYNQGITGDPLVPPHLGYTYGYNPPPEFIFQADPGPGFGYQKRAPVPPPSGDARAPAARSPWVSKAVSNALGRLSRSLNFFLGGALVLALFFALPSRRHRVLAAACLIVFAGQALTLYWFPHYGAPMVAPLFVLALLGLRRLRVLRWRGRRFGRAVVPIVLVIEGILFLVQVPAYRADDDDWSVERARIVERLSELPGKHLVVIRDPKDWISNAADIDAAKIVWARDRGSEANRELLDYFDDRRVWRLDLADLQLKPYGQAAARR